jgi:hypothetical protein
MNGSQKVAFVNPGQLGRIFALNQRAGIPTCVIGDNGTGKTTAVEDYVGKLNRETTNGKWNLWKLILGVLEPSDIGGYPVPKKNKDKDVVEYCMASHMDFFDSKVKGIILADEFDRAKPDVQNAFLQFLLGRKIHGHELSPNVYLIMTMNGAADIYTTPLSKAARTRVCTVYVSHSAKNSLTEWDNWSSDNDVNPLTRGFARFRPDLLKCHETYEELAAFTPRTLVEAGKVLDAAEKVSFPVDDILFPVLAGIVGKATATEMLGYRELYLKCPDPDVILADPDNAEIPSDPGIIYALGLALIAKVDKGDKAKAEAVVKYAVRLKNELTAFVLKALGEKFPNAYAMPVYQKWAENHKMILL